MCLNISNSCFLFLWSFHLHLSPSRSSS
ncbi:hypothetical protein NP493_125g01003 [Ridgeia piscesae]|uniref:Uncharacterized protein n=1 Tax=Ridgeia piscesae TaxID=27915 RepID=A0AAD9P642_RIDPI|nr:hypothetical protein NP493_125g01003 [Ridgeia piscesae]